MSNKKHYYCIKASDAVLERGKWIDMGPCDNPITAAGRFCNDRIHPFNDIDQSCTVRVREGIDGPQYEVDLEAEIDVQWTCFSCNVVEDENAKQP